MIDDENEVFSTELREGVSLTIYEPITPGETLAYRMEFIHGGGVNWFYLDREECRLIGGILTALGSLKS